MKPLDLAFTEPSKRLGWVVLAAGAALLGGVLFARQHLANERAYLVAERARLASLLPAPVPARIDPSAQTDQARLQLASAELGRDWEQLFAPIERAATPELRLLSIDPDTNAGSAVITADAPTYEFAVEYTERLAAYGLRAVTLLSHGANPNADGRVRFKISANWGSR